MPKGRKYIITNPNLPFSLRLTEMIDKFKAKVSLFSENWFHLNINPYDIVDKSTNNYVNTCKWNKMRRKTSERVMIEIDNIQIYRDSCVSLLSSCI